MTNTKFRKRALLSSVAMLLVALVALGSATFAWFSADPNAHTKGLSLKATASTGLLIQSDTEKSYIQTNSSTMTGDYWSHTAVLNAATYSSASGFATGDTVAIGAASQDASSGTGKGIYRVDAASDGASAADNSKAVTEAGNGDRYEEKLYLKVTGAESASVKLQRVAATTVGSTSLAQAIRVAVLKSNGEVLGIFKPAGSRDNYYLTQTASTYNTSGVKSSATYSGIAFSTTTDSALSIGTVGNNGSDYVTVRVYLDGEDQDVYSLNIAQADLSSIISDIKIDFAIVS